MAAAEPHQNVSTAPASKTKSPQFVELYVWWISAITKIL